MRTGKPHSSCSAANLSNLDVRLRNSSAMSVKASIAMSEESENEKNHSILQWQSLKKNTFKERTFETRVSQ